MDKEIKSRQAVKNTVIIIDFVVMNVILFLLLGTSRGYDFRVFVEANISLAAAEYFFSTILHRRRTTADRILRQVSYLAAVQISLFFVISKLGLVYRYGSAPTLVQFVWFAVAFYGAMLAVRFGQLVIVRCYRRRPENRQKVVLVGSDPALLPIADYLASDPTLGYEVAGYYSDTAATDFPADLRRLGSLADIEALLNDPSTEMPSEVYLSMPAVKGDNTLHNIVRSCNRAGVRFYYTPSISTSIGHNFRQERIGESIVFTAHPEPLAMTRNKVLKRTFDIIVSTIILLPTLLATPVIAIIIKRQSPGPLFFRQLRTGIGGEEFQCYKFRSMHINADADKLQATKDDPRKFAFGDFMRKTNIDELPQFWNVLKGDMSIVGPRPHMLLHTEQYRKLIDTYMIRHFVRPGVTGWAQVTGFRGETKELWQMEGRVKRDIWYIENWSIWLDIRIIWKTAKQIIIPDKKAY